MRQTGVGCDRGEVEATVAPLASCLADGRDGLSCAQEEMWFLSRLHGLFEEQAQTEAADVPRIAALASLPDASAGLCGPQYTPVIQPAAHGGTLPASSGQRRLWLIDQMLPGSGADNYPCFFTLRGELDIEALRWAVSQLVQRHQSLRTTFQSHRGEPVQVIAEAQDVDLRVSPLPVAVGDDEGLRDWLEREAGRCFDLGAGPLFRCAVYRLAKHEHLFLLNFHHIISDGWSLGLLYEELDQLYEAAKKGGTSPLQALPIQYADYAAWCAEQAASEQMTAQLDWWRQQLEGAPTVLELPADRPRPALASRRGESLRFGLDGELSEQLAELARSEGTTTNMVLHAALCVVLFRYTDCDELLLGIAHANRGLAELERMVGHFVNTLGIPWRFAGQASCPRVRTASTASRSRPVCPRRGPERPPRPAARTLPG